MPRLKRKTLLKRRTYGRGHVHHLWCGHQFLDEGFGRPVGNLEAMREAWPVLREQVFALCAERHAKGDLRIKPVGWWLFEAPEERNEGETEREQLERLGLLEPGEAG